MTIEEMKRKRNEMCKKVTDIINAFESESQCYVESIDLVRHHAFTNLEGLGRLVNARLQIKVP